MNRREFLGYSGSATIFSLSSSVFKEIENDEKIEYDIDTPYSKKYQDYTRWLSNPDLNEENLQIHHINVGGANSTLVSSRSTDILIDAGHTYHNAKYILNYLDSMDINSLDQLILTHNHWDHIGGVPQIIKEYSDTIKNILCSGVENTSETYKEYIRSATSHDVPRIIVDEGYNNEILKYGDIKIINPSKNIRYRGSGGSNDFLNNNSIVLKISLDNRSLLVPADIEQRTQRFLLDKYKDQLSSDIIQIPHHGAGSSYEKTFLNSVDPSLSVLSSAYYSTRGLPSQDVINKYRKKNIDIFWTAYHGSIITETDGETWSVYTQKGTKPINSIKNKEKIGIPPSEGFHNRYNPLEY